MEVGHSRVGILEIEARGVPADFAHERIEVQRLEIDLADGVGKANVCIQGPHGPREETRDPVRRGNRNDPTQDVRRSAARLRVNTGRAGQRLVATRPVGQAKGQLAPTDRRVVSFEPTQSVRDPQQAVGSAGKDPLDHRAYLASNQIPPVHLLEFAFECDSPITQPARTASRRRTVRWRYPRALFDGRKPWLVNIHKAGNQCRMPEFDQSLDRHRPVVAQAAGILESARLEAFQGLVQITHRSSPGGFRPGGSARTDQLPSPGQSEIEYTSIRTR